ncbi:ABC transporter substrate-binding protein [Paenibacillus turpanensis]|uniref:ABC transporter substrate-binding protein n=1 Tax=Paenibacillus turpanensis TaxID=2689078 RepID=UPI001407B87A|nr:ABC transporter substrate binding protein [Paenibacillus turpanensis]
MSYHSPWIWTDGQFSGFQSGLGTDVKVEYRTVQMNAKNNSSEDWLKSKGDEIEQLITEWKPDLVYTTDDEAQQYVTSRFVHSTTPFVFSGVNRQPAFYGLDGASNVTGVLETEHFAENIRLLQELAPNVRKIALVFDDAPLWEPVIARIRKETDKFPDIQWMGWEPILSYKDYQSKILEYQSQVDAIGIIGVFNFKDSSGKNVHYTEVLKWTAENSMLPDFSFWKDRVAHGTLSAVTVSGFEQGFQAGKMARTIIVEGKQPSELEIRPTKKGEAIISLARANKLGLKLKSGLLLDSLVYTRYEWEK